jgi:L-ascorbate metabolism protein UlaG (beta-lactamase superfamily)
MSGSIRLARDAKFEVTYGEADSTYDPRVDCMLLFLGDRLQPLGNAYEEAAQRLAETADPASLFDALQSSEFVTEFYDVGRDGEQVSITMRDSIFRQAGPLSGGKFRLAVSRGEARLLRPVPRHCFRALGTLWPLLEGDYSEAEIHSQLKASLGAVEAGWADSLLAALGAGGFLEPAPTAPNRFVRPGLRPRVTFMGHTSLLFESANSAVLLDPMLPPGSPYAALAADVTRLKLGAICCTHHHRDHCDPATLLRFDKSTPVIVAHVPRPSAVNPPMAEAVRMLGFTDVREARTWEPIQIGDIEFVPTPFHGEEDEPGLEIDHYTYVLRSGGFAIYGGVDCFRDASGEMIPVMEKIRADYQPQVSFLPISKFEAQYREGGVNRFCRYMDRELVKQSFQYTAGPEEAADWLASLDTRYVVPYATFTLSRWDTPRPSLDFYRVLRARGLQRRLYPLRPLDSLEAAEVNSGMSVGRRQALLAWLRLGRSLRDLRKRLQARGVS